ncbi:hypothetical protein K439DRAFT_1647350 [Ramaria rubella]|nr:hypothetical protein K439DRAFT_1647350 [Ramaria rubella]
MVERLKEAITKDAVHLAVNWMASGKAWYIIFDNLNIYLQKFEQWLTNKNAMLNITNVTIIGQSDVDPEVAYNLDKFLTLWGIRSQATGADIEITPVDSEYMVGIVVQLLVAYCPKGLVPLERPLPPHKTETFPFRSKKGVIEVIEAIHLKSKLSEEEWTSKVCIAEGDWLTSNNLRGAKCECVDDVSDLSAKWHFALNYSHLLMKVHFRNTIDDPGSLASHKGLLGRTWDVNKPNYSAAKSLIVKEFATSTVAAKAQESGDDWLAHSSYFIWDSLLFLVFEHYISFADAGGVLRVLKFWAFSFRGAGMWNYAWECLKVLLLWKYELTPELQEEMEKAWFVNRNTTDTGIYCKFLPFLGIYKCASSKSVSLTDHPSDANVWSTLISFTPAISYAVFTTA